MLHFYRRQYCRDQHSPAGCPELQCECSPATMLDTTMNGSAVTLAVLTSDGKGYAVGRTQTVLQLPHPSLKCQEKTSQAFQPQAKLSCQDQRNSLLSILTHACILVFSVFSAGRGWPVTILVYWPTPAWESLPTTCSFTAALLDGKDSL